MDLFWMQQTNCDQTFLIFWHFSGSCSRLCSRIQINVEWSRASKFLFYQSWKTQLRSLNHTHHWRERTTRRSAPKMFCSKHYRPLLKWSNAACKMIRVTPSLSILLNGFVFGVMAHLSHRSVWIVLIWKEVCSRYNVALKAQNVRGDGTWLCVIMIFIF